MSEGEAPERRRRPVAVLAWGWNQRTKIAIAVVVALVVVMLALVGWLLGPGAAWWLDHVDRVDLPTDKDREAALDAFRGRVLALATGIAALTAVCFTAINAKTARDTLRHNADTARETTRLALQGQVTDLYGRAADQLGSDKAPVRLAALYALERVANDHPAHRQTIVNLLCAYLRMPYTPPPAEAASAGSCRGRDRRHQLRFQTARRGAVLATEPETPGPDPHEERQVRLTAQRLLTAHLRPDSPGYWGSPQPITVDLAGATLLDFDLRECTLHTADFGGASFSRYANFGDARFSGRAVFGDARFSGRAVFEGARFSRTAVFGGARFSRTAVFGGVLFSGDAVFEGARFSRTAVFEGARFSRTAVFEGVSFSGRAVFEGARFSRTAVFEGVSFSGDADFRYVLFSGDAVFEGATFSRYANFRDAVVADPGREHVWPPGWAVVQPAGGGAGRLMQVPPPGPGGAGEDQGGEEPGGTG